MRFYEKALTERMNQLELDTEIELAKGEDAPLLDSSDLDSAFDEEQKRMAEVCAPYDITNDGHRFRALDKVTGKMICVAKNSQTLVYYLERRSAE